MPIPPAHTLYPKITAANEFIDRRFNEANEYIERFFLISILPQFRSLIAEKVQHATIVIEPSQNYPISSKDFSVTLPSEFFQPSAHPGFPKLADFFNISRFSYTAPRIHMPGGGYLGMFFEDYPISKLIAPLAEELTNLGYQDVFIDFNSSRSHLESLSLEDLSFRIRFEAKLPNDLRKD